MAISSEELAVTEVKVAVPSEDEVKTGTRPQVKLILGIGGGMLEKWGYLEPEVCKNLGKALMEAGEECLRAHGDKSKLTLATPEQQRAMERQAGGIDKLRERPQG